VKTFPPLEDEEDDDEEDELDWRRRRLRRWAFTGWTFDWWPSESKVKKARGRNWPAVWIKSN